MSNPAIQAAKDAHLAVYDVLAARGAKTGKGFIRTGFVPHGRRKAIADAVAPFVPADTTWATAGTVAQSVAARLHSDPKLRAEIDTRAGRITAQAEAPGSEVTPSP